MKNADAIASPVVVKVSPFEKPAVMSGVPSEKVIGGLTKREMMAMHMMQGLLAAPDLNTVEPCAVASTAIAYTDAILAELEKQQ